MRASIAGTALYFQQRVRVLPSGCVEWTGELSRNGYGRAVVGYKGRRPIRRLAHRMLYEMWLGKIPDGLELDHLCRNRACCNPLHLEPVSRKENVRRGLIPLLMRDPLWNPTKRVEVCHRGHPMIGDNVRLSANQKWRRCLACKREYARKYARAKKEKTMKRRRR